MADVAPQNNEPQNNPANEPDELEQFAAFVAQEILDLKAAIPAASDPVAPIINVSAPPAEVTVNVPQQDAPTVTPIINISATPIEVNVAPAGPEINLNTQSITLTADIQPVVDAIGAGFDSVVAAIREGFTGMCSMMQATMQEHGQMGAGHASMVVDSLNSMGAAIEGQQRSLAMMVGTLSAPRTIMTDDKGMPTGIKIERMRAN
jgi:hypothetical protein